MQISSTEKQTIPRRRFRSGTCGDGRVEDIVVNAEEKVILCLLRFASWMLKKKAYYQKANKRAKSKRDINLKILLRTDINLKHQVFVSNIYYKKEKLLMVQKEIGET